MLKDAEELSKITAADMVTRRQEAQQEQKIENLKQEYRQAATPQEKEVIAAQIVEEDKNFLSNLKLREGNKYRDEDNHKQAEKSFSEAIELNPDNALAWHNRGAAKSWLNQMREAVADYDKAIELKPNYAKAYENRGKAYGALGEDDKAAADFQRSIKIISSNKGADKIIEETEALLKRGDYTEALELLNKAAELYPDNQFVFVNRGNIYNNKLRDYDAAIADYNKTLELNPKFSWPYLNRGIAYGRLKRWDEAIADYGRALEIDPNYAAAYNGRAWSYCQIGKFEEVLVDADRAIELKPNEANYLETRACAYIGLKRYADALADMNIAIKLLPEGWLFSRRPEIYQLMGDETKAKADADRARQGN